MSTRKLQQSTIPFYKSKVTTSQKQRNPPVVDDLLLQCPICNQSYKKSVIEQHIEKCILEHNTELKSVSSDEYKEIVQSQVLLATPSPIKSDIHSSFSQLTSQKDISQTQLNKSPKETTRKSRTDRRPLAERLRPSTFDDVVGNADLFSTDSVIRTLLEHDPPPSIILYGPPGCGKTTIATIISNRTKCPFHSLSCCLAGIQDIKSAAEKAEKDYRLHGLPTILFMDEIHRFNKKQQDIFLPYVENGQLILIGATTENPSFSINSALLSRCRVISLHSLQSSDLCDVMKRALVKDNYLNQSHITVSDTILLHIAQSADGDARMALNILDACCSYAYLQHLTDVTDDMIKQALSQRYVRYDKNGEEHYNLISAFQKSIRGSDIQAALYWLVRMIEGGEDPLYIARRLLVIASEDVGLSDPQALLIATSCYQACNEIGLPECNLALAECTAYLALASKSNEITLAYSRIQKLIQQGDNPPVPLHIRNAPIKSMEDLGYGIGYQYGYNKNQTYLPKQYLNKRFFDVQRAVTDLRTISLEREDKRFKNDI